jgi:hypothetical protein
MELAPAFSCQAFHSLSFLSCTSWAFGNHFLALL